MENKVESTENQQEANANDVEGVEKLRLELAAATQALAESKDQYLRLLADFDNFRKRSLKEKAELTQFAAEDVLVSLLPTLDNFERTLSVMEKTDNLSSIKEGIQMVWGGVKKTLEQKGLKVMETKGQPFDSALHEAIANIPAPAADLAGKVVDEVEKGYRLHEKVIRYAKVIVGE